MDCLLHSAQQPTQDGFGGGPTGIAFLKFLDRDGFAAGSGIRWGQWLQHLVNGVKQGATDAAKARFCALGSQAEVVHADVGMSQRGLARTWRVQGH